MSRRSRSPKKSLIAALESRGIRPIRESPRQLDRLVVRLFQADKEHRPVRLLEDRLPDFDRVVRPNGKEEAVEGGVMQPAQRQPVAHDRVTFVLRVLDDVGGIEQLLVVEAADGALLAGRHDRIKERKKIEQDGTVVIERRHTPGAKAHRIRPLRFVRG